MIGNLIKRKNILTNILFLILIAAICLFALPAAALADGPDQVVLSLTEQTDAYTVRFRLPDTFTDAQYVEYVPSAVFDQPDQSTQVEAASLPLEDSGYNVFTAKMINLAPGTVYAYRVGNDEEWSDWYYFETPAIDESSFDFLYMSDTQAEPEIGSYEEWGDLLQTALTDFNPAFTLIGGDLINEGNDPAEWADFFAAADEGFAGVPLMRAVGNHDYSGLCRNIIAQPQNGPAGYEGTVYSFDYGNAHIIALDSNALGNSDNAALFTSWLEADLSQAQDKTWKIVMQHHPYYPANTNSKDQTRAETMRQYILPVLEEYGVDMILCGHQHSYMRTYPMKEGEASTHLAGGILHVMNVSGPKQYSAADHGYIAFTEEEKLMYLKISVNGNNLSIVAKDTFGNTVDTYHWSKSADAVNEGSRLLNQANPITSISAAVNYTIAAKLSDNILAANALAILQIRANNPGIKNSGSVVTIVSKQVSLTPGGEITIDFTMPAGISGKCYADIMLWDDLDKQTPIADPIYGLAFNVST